MKDNFYIVLPSNSCPLTQPDNNASLFTVDYNNSFKLTGDWEVALTEFNCIHSPISLYGGSKISWTMAKPLEHSVRCKLRVVHGKLIQYFPRNMHVYMVGKRVVFKYNRPFSMIFSEERNVKDFGHDTYIVDSINQNVIISSNDGNVITSGEFVNDFYDFDISIVYYEKDIKDVTFIKDANFKNNMELLDHIRVHCLDVFKEVTLFKDILTFTIHDNIKSVSLDDKLVKLMGFEKSKFVPENIQDTKFIGNKKVQLKSVFNHFYIYSSLVDPIFVGSDRVPLLKNIWLENIKSYEYGDVIYVSIDQPMYIPLAVTDINKIEINIRSDSGKLINFIEGSKSSLTLHFRKKNE